MRSWSRIGFSIAFLGLVGVMLRLFDLLLMKEHLEEPGIVFAWMLLAWLLAGAAGIQARLISPRRRGLLARAGARIGSAELVAFASFLTLLFLFHWGYERTASDGREYFIQLRSAVKDWDLEFAADSAKFGARGTAGRFPVGGPILWLPFYLAADVWQWMLNLTGADLPRNGYSNPYQRAVGLATLVYGFIGLVLAYRIVRDYFSRTVSATSLTAVCAGTFVLWYLVVDNSMVHGMSMFAATLFIYIWYRTAGERGVNQWALLGATAGLMTMVRWQNAAFVLFPTYEILRSYGRILRNRASATNDESGVAGRDPAEIDGDVDPVGLQLGSVFLRHGAFAVAGVAAFLPQLFFWWVVRGNWIGVPLRARGIRSETFEPVIVEALFSPEKGLFSWTPVTLLAVIGLIPFVLGRAREHSAGTSGAGELGSSTPMDRPRVSAPLFGGLLLAAFLAQTVINGMVRWTGHGFGARGFTNCTLVFAVGLAALLAWLRHRPLLSPLLILGSLVVVNLSFMREVQKERLPGTSSISAHQIVGTFLEDVGNPFMLPVSLIEAWRHGADLTIYERLGEQRYNNLILDMGATDVERFLARGWDRRETEPERRYSFRWTLGDEATLVAPLKESDQYMLEMYCLPMNSPDGAPQIMEIRINGALIERLALTPGLRKYQVRIPADRIRKGHNDVVFRYRYSVSPESLGIGTDPRQLAVRYVWIKLLRQ